jgi:hypothetical protein
VSAENEPDIALVVFEREFYWRDVEREQWNPKPVSKYIQPPEGNWLAVKVMQNHRARLANCYLGLQKRWQRTKGA